MSKPGETVSAFCPECDEETRHKVVAVDDEGEPTTVECTSCATQHSTEEEDLEDESLLDSTSEDEDDSEDEEASEDEGSSDDGDGDDGDDDDDDDDDGMSSSMKNRSALAGLGASAFDDADAADDDDDEDDDDDGADGDDDGADSDDDEVEEPVAKKKPRKKARKKSTRAEASLSWEDDVAGADQSKARPYRITDAFEVGELVTHPKFGLGRVVEILGDTKVAILFEAGQKTMIQRHQ